MKKPLPVLKAMARLATSALTWFFLLRTAGVFIATAGVYLLFGSGWALIAFGVSLMVASEFVRRGMIGA